MRIHGGTDAPLRARTSVLAQLSGQLTECGAADLALIVSELVTNSVRHANVGPDQSLTVECADLVDHLRITVTDPGSDLQPHLRSPDRLAAGGCGLKVIDLLCSAWGVRQGPAGATSVWCELPIDAAPAVPLHGTRATTSDKAMNAEVGTGGPG